MGISLDVEDMRICLNEADEVGHQLFQFFSQNFLDTFPHILFDLENNRNRILGWRRKAELSGVF